jgi:hypothetical protein
MTKKRLIKLALSMFLILGIIVGIIYVVLLNQLTESKAKELVVNAYNTSSIISAAKGFDGYVRDLQYQVVISDGNLLSPKISLVRASFYPTDSTKDLYDIFTLSFKRTGFNTWEVKDYKYSTSANLTFDKILHYAKTQDIYTNNPDSANIRNIPYLTPQEIESNQKLREGEQAQKRIEKEFNASTPEGGKKLCEDDIQEAKNIFEAAKRGDKTYQAKRQIVELDQTKLALYEKEIQDIIKFCAN